MKYQVLFALTVQQTTFFVIFYFHLWKKIRLNVSCDSSVGQRTHMTHQALFSLTMTQFKTVVCFSRDWR